MFPNRRFFLFYLLGLFFVLQTAGLASPQDDGNGKGTGTPAGVVPRNSLSGSFTGYKHLHALIIGINWKGENPIRYADRDARELADVLIKQYGFKRENIRVLVNEQATRDEIEFALNQLSASKHRQMSLRNKASGKTSAPNVEPVEAVEPDDAVVVFISTHGKKYPVGDPDAAAYILPYGSSLDAETPDDCISMASITEKLNNVRARHILLLADHCYSGSYNHSKASPADVVSVIHKLGQYPARQVITAGKSDQIVDERDRLQHGVFTYYLLGLLRQFAQSCDAFTVNALYSRLQTTEATTASQTPDLGNLKDGVTGDFIFFPVGSGPRVRTATVQVSVSNTKKFEVWINGQHSETAVGGSYRIDLQDGEEQTIDVEVRADGFLNLTKQASLSAGDAVPLRFTLKPNPLEDTSAKPTGTIAIPGGSLGRGSVRARSAAPTKLPNPARFAGAAAPLNTGAYRAMPLYKTAEQSFYAGRLREAENLLRGFAEAGDPRAQGMLGFCLEIMPAAEPVKSALQSEAFRWCQKSADQSDPFGMAELGMMYETGKGTSTDPTLARVWYDKCRSPLKIGAQNGDVLLQFQIGRMYANSQGFGSSGTSENDVEAVQWYREVVEAGNTETRRNVGLMHKRGRAKGISDQVKNDTEAVRWYRKAAEAGNTNAQTDLGWMYENGRGVDLSDRAKNRETALQWYRKAAKQGNESAKAAVKRLTNTK